MEVSIGILKELNSCITTLRLYPAENKLVTRTLDALTNRLSGYFESKAEEDVFNISRAEGKIIVNDKIMDDKQNKNPIIISIQSLFELLDLKSITVYKGVEKNELVAFFKIINEIKSKALTEKSSLQEIMARRGINKIKVDETIYIAMARKDKEALDEAEVDIADIIKNRLIKPDKGRVLDKIDQGLDLNRFYGDPESVGRVLNSLISNNYEMSHVQKNRNMTTALNKLANLIPEDKEEYLVGLFSMLKNISPDLSTSFLMTRVATQKKPTIDADKLILYLDDRTLGAFVDEIERLEPQFNLQTEKLHPDKKDLYRKRVKEFLQKLQSYIHSLSPKNEKSLSGSLAEEAEQSGQHKLKIDEMILNDIRANFPKIDEFPKIRSIGQLFRVLDKSDHTRVFDEIRKSIYNDRMPYDEFLKYYSEELNNLISDPEAEKNTISDIVKSMLSQAESETELSVWYAGLIFVLEQNIGLLYKCGYFDIAGMLLFSLKNQIENEGSSREKEQVYFAYSIYNRIDKQPYYDSAVKDYMEGVSTPDSPEVKLMESYPDEFINPVMKFIKNPIDKKAGKKAARYLSRAEEAVVDSIIQELEKDYPWHVYRNIIFILGETGFESTIFLIKKFLVHDDRRISKEAVKALLKIRSESAIKALSEKFLDLDDKMKLQILNSLQANELLNFLKPIKDYLRGDQLFSGRNKKLLESIMTSLHGISSKESFEFIEDVLWGKSQKLLEREDRGFIINLILEILFDNKEPPAEDIIKKMMEDERGFIKNAAAEFSSKSKTGG